MRPLDWRAHLPEGSRQVAQADLTSGGTLMTGWSSSWASDPSARCLLDLTGRGSPADWGRWVSAGELDERTRRAAGALRASGLGDHDRVLWVADRSLRSVVAALGVLRAGSVLVPIDPSLTEREVRHVMSEVSPQAAVSDDARVTTILRAEAERAGGGLVMVDSGLGITEGRPLPASAPIGIDEAGPAWPALIGFTSGTTGAPKGAVLTHANLLANAESLRLAWRWTPEDRLVHALPLFHGHGLCAALFGTLHAGASAVLLGGFDAGLVCESVADHAASLFFGVPTMYHRLASAGRCGELRALRLAVSGSAPLPAELHRDIELSCGVHVLERYGMTETLLTVSNPCEGERRPGSIGFPLPGTEVLLRVPDGGPSPDDGAELAVRGPTVFSGYFEKPAQTAERFCDGWFMTGDVGVVEGGYVRLLGRLTDVVISGGHNVYPAEVEDVLLSYPGVAEVAVSGTPSDEWGEVVTAWVVPTDGVLDHDALLAHAASALASYKRPRLVRQVDSLPRNAMGKVMRRELHAAPQ